MRPDRPDLLALAPEDLAALANRGLVRRARKEVERGAPAGALELTDDGALAARWEDGAACALPPDAPLDQRQCSCPAATVCRHLVRTVLAYQAAVAAGAPPASDDAPPPGAPAPAPVVEPWDPGGLDDAALAATFRKRTLTRARARLEEGLTVELVRARKPAARFLELVTTIRFLAPGSLQLTHCDCGDPAPCGHVPLAVWAFRRLDPEAEGGLVETAPAAADPAAADLAAALEAGVGELLRDGVAPGPEAAAARLERLERRCRAADWVWPAEALAGMTLAARRYAARDARFDPVDLAAAAGELLARRDALAVGGELPAGFVRGSGQGGGAGGHARLVGLGVGVEVRARSVELQAFFQDADSGAVVAATREELDPEEGPPRSFPELARRQAFPGAAFRDLGRRSLQLRGGRRAPDGRLRIGRKRHQLAAQAFAWESLRAPLLVDGWEELRARLAALPPAALRPRTVAEGLHVVRLARAEGARFDPREQAVRAALVDADGAAAELAHPFTSRGREGAEHLLRELDGAGERVRFAAGRIRARAGRLALEPVAVVLDDPESGGRRLVAPWIDRLPPDARPVLPDGPPPGRADADPLAAYRRDLLLGLGELLVAGLGRAGARTAARWRARAREGEALGFDRLAARVAALAAALEARQASLARDPAPAVAAAGELLVLARLAEDL